MSDVVLISLISLGGTLTGTFGGIVTANRLTVYRIEQLEKKVEKHNNLVERMFAIEAKITNISHRVDELEERE
jgi:tetrahydromethanopterin S-methyltransferase subunit G